MDTESLSAKPAKPQGDLILLWGVPIYWTILYCAILFAVNLLTAAVRMPLYTVMPAAVLKGAFIAGFVVAYGLLLWRGKSQIALRATAPLVWCALMWVAGLVFCISESSIVKTFATSAGCPPREMADFK